MQLIKINGPKNMFTGLIRLAAALLLLAIAAPVNSAKDKKTSDQNPIAFGLLSQNAGCVLFQEGHKTSGMFWGVAVTTKTVGKLTVIETQNYTMDQKEILETQENMDGLLQRAEGPFEVRQDP